MYQVPVHHLGRDAAVYGEQAEAGDDYGRGAEGGGGARPNVLRRVALNIYIYVNGGSVLLWN